MLACAPSVAPTQCGRDFGSAMSGRVVLDDTIRERAGDARVALFENPNDGNQLLWDVD
jgi:hypothetical protein